MALDVYMKIDGIDGESLDAEHKKWIEILSFDQGIIQPSSATASTSGGGTAERVSFEDLTITKLVDSASPKLYELCCTGKHIPKISLEFLRSSGDKRVKYLAIEMKQVVVSKTHTHLGPNVDFPTETVEFNFGTIKWNYIPQKRDGNTQGNIPGGWDLTSNKKIA